MCAIAQAFPIGRKLRTLCENWALCLGRFLLGLLSSIGSNRFVVALSSDASVVSPPSPDRGAIDASIRQPVLFFIGSACVWLVAAAALRWLLSVESLFPADFGGAAVLSYGRIEAASRMAAIFGWAALAGYGVALWLLARLGGVSVPGWGRSILFAAAVAWNAALLAGVAALLGGASTGVEGLELPLRAGGVLWAVQVLLAVFGAAFFAARRSGPLYVSQAYLLAALAGFPAVFGLSEAVLAANGAGAGAGSAQAAALAWFSGALFALWLLPLGLGILYYLLPKVLGRPVESGGTAWFGFWSLALIGGWTGGSRLTGGTAPAWVASAGISAHIALLVPGVAVGWNLFPLLRGRLGSLALRASPVLRCAAVALAALVAFQAEGFLTGFRSVGDLVRFTYWEEARSAVGLDLFAAMALYGAIYFMAPRLAGWEWPSLRLIRIHFWGAGLGAGFLVGALATGGLIEGLGVADARVPFAAVASMTLPFLWMRSAALLMMLLAQAAFALHFARLLLRTGPLRAGAGPTLFAVGPHVLTPTPDVPTP